MVNNGNSQLIVLKKSITKKLPNLSILVDCVCINQIVLFLRQKLPQRHYQQPNLEAPMHAPKQDGSVYVTVAQRPEAEVVMTKVGGQCVADAGAEGRMFKSA